MHDHSSSEAVDWPEERSAQSVRLCLVLAFHATIMRDPEPPYLPPGHDVSYLQWRLLLEPHTTV